MGYSWKNHNNPHHFKSQAFSEINLWFEFVEIECVCHFKCTEYKRFNELHIKSSMTCLINIKLPY